MSYVTSKPNVPNLFKVIMENDRQRAALKAASVIPFEAYRSLSSERTEFRRAAEKALQWNVDKGNTAR
jgi:hypothetical protein